MWLRKPQDNEEVERVEEVETNFEDASSEDENLHDFYSFLFLMILFLYMIRVHIVFIKTSNKKEMIKKLFKTLRLIIPFLIII